MLLLLKQIQFNLHRSNASDLCVCADMCEESLVKLYLFVVCIEAY